VIPAGKVEKGEGKRTKRWNGGAFASQKRLAVA
jgi:hypothetical protein